MFIVLSFHIVCASVDSLQKVVILVMSNFFLRSCSQGIPARSLRLGAGGTSCLSKWEQCPRQPWQQKQTAYSIDSGQHSNSDYTRACVMETAGMWLLFLILFSSNDNHKFKCGGRLDNLNICAFESLFAFALPSTTCWLSRTQCCIRQKVKLTKLDGYFMPSPMRKLWYGRLNVAKLRTGSFIIL